MEQPFFTALSRDRTLREAPVRLFGYYVFCRGGHYILQAYNVNGYDERWEANEWMEVDVNTLEPYNFENWIEETKPKKQ